MSAAFDREEKPDNHKKPQKHYKMPTEVTGTITVVEAADTSHFPGTGVITKLYYDLSSGNDWATGDFYLWNGTNYTAYLGPHPAKPGH